MSLVRVFEIPPRTGKFHFGGGEPQTFVEVDWFRDENSPPEYSFETPEGRMNVEIYLRQKRYFQAGKAYLVLHPQHSFTIDYEPDNLRG